MGTASYVAPEVRSAGNGKYNEKADVSVFHNFTIFARQPRSTALPTLTSCNCAASLLSQEIRDLCRNIGVEISVPQIGRQITSGSV